jgi:hypothetical protein
MLPSPLRGEEPAPDSIRGARRADEGRVLARRLKKLSFEYCSVARLILSPQSFLRTGEGAKEALRAL